MRKSLLAIIAILFIMPAFAQTNSDYETAVHNIQAFYNQRQTDSLFNMFSDKMKQVVPLDKATMLIGNLHDQFGAIKSIEPTKQKDGFNFYKATFNTETLSMVISLDKENKLGTFRFVPYKADAAAKSEKSNFILRTATGNIYGTLVTPEGNKKTPVVLIIPGSGPTDRDGNNNMGMRTNAYLMIADSLQNKGIASVRYDKRGVGESYEDFKVEDNLSFDEMVNDAIGFVKMLKEDKRFSKVIILGHSEGSLIGMIAANREKVSAFISVAGISESADKIIIKQIESQSKELAAKAAIILDSLKKGYTVKNIDPSLNALFRPSVQPYMRSWLKYDPAAEIKKLKKNVLIVQGTTDIQVNMEEAEKLKEDYPRAVLKIITGMNHVLKQSPMDKKQNIATYSDPGLPLSPEFVTVVVNFINQLN